MKEIRVVLIDDHPIMSAGIRNVLEKAPDISIVGEAHDEVTALCLVEDKAPHVALLDMEMLNLTGVEIAHQLQAAASPTRILVLSDYDGSTSSSCWRSERLATWRKAKHWTRSSKRCAEWRMAEWPG